MIRNIGYAVYFIVWAIARIKLLLNDGYYGITYSVMAIIMYIVLDITKEK